MARRQGGVLRVSLPPRLVQSAALENRDPQAVNDRLGGSVKIGRVRQFARDAVECGGLVRLLLPLSRIVDRLVSRLVGLDGGRFLGVLLGRALLGLVGAGDQN